MLSVFVRDIEFLESMEDVKPNHIALDGFICKQPVVPDDASRPGNLRYLAGRSTGPTEIRLHTMYLLGRNARFAGNLEIGSRIELIGRIQSREYQKRISENEIIKRTAYEVSVNKLEIHEKDA